MDPSSKPNGQTITVAPLGLSEPRVKRVLERLHEEAKRDRFVLPRMLPAVLLARLKGAPASIASKPLVAKGFLSVAPSVGDFLYLTARAIDGRQAVEFGTSFGISSIYLAAAMRDNGGRFVGSEIEASKVSVARRNLDEAGLSPFSKCAKATRCKRFVTLLLRSTWCSSIGGRTFICPCWNC